MKAVFQRYGSGELTVAEVPPPSVQPGGVLVRNAASLVSAGTERLMVELARKGLLGKARERPDLVRQVLDKVRRDGVLATIQTVRSRLDKPVPLGYSCAGVILEVGEGARDFRVGDPVACAGAGYASHAEVVFVPKNLCVRIPWIAGRSGPDGDRAGLAPSGSEALGEMRAAVPFEEACFAAIGAVALHGLRLAQIQLGETVAIVGLGLVGLLAGQLAKAAGCTVVGMDPNASRCRLAEDLSLDAACADEMAFRGVIDGLTSGRGADKVIIAASAKGNEPVTLAGEVARDKGTVVAVGAVGLKIPRAPYYEKELTFLVSRSYGPGRYDPEYEEKGRDYPVGFVRWTEKRNMEAFLQMVAQGRVKVGPLISHRLGIEDAPKGYDLITGKDKGDPLGIVIVYERAATEGEEKRSGQRALEAAGPPSRGSSRAGVARPGARGRASRDRRSVRVGLLGAGEFARETLIPAMRNVRGIELVGVCTATGISGDHVARKFGFRYSTTDERMILDDADINTVAIATRHHLHARQVIAGLEAGKHVFVEKPLCLTESQLKEIISTFNHVRQKTRSDQVGHSGQTDETGETDQRDQTDQILMVGYNRRFAPMAIRLKEFLRQVDEPLVMHYRVNAGYIPPGHWVHDPGQGGGRVMGEVCHFVDFLIFIAASLPARVYARALPNEGRYCDDNVAVTIEFANGSLGTITYVAGGDRSLPKERIEVLGGGVSAVLDNFRRLEVFWKGRRRVTRSLFGQDKGHRGEWEAFVGAIDRGGGSPIACRELIMTTSTTMRIAEALKAGAAVDLVAPSSLAPDLC